MQMTSNCIAVVENELYCGVILQGWPISIALTCRDLGIVDRSCLLYSADPRVTHPLRKRHFFEVGPACDAMVQLTEATWRA